jgi:hypothetical protein
MTNKQPTGTLPDLAHTARLALIDFWAAYFVAAGDDGRNTYRYNTTLRIFQAVNDALAAVEMQGGPAATAKVEQVAA